MIVTDEFHVVTDECHVMINAHLFKFEEKKHEYHIAIET